MKNNNLNTNLLTTMNELSVHITEKLGNKAM